MISSFLVGMDDSDMAEEALKYALTAHPDAEISVLAVVGKPSPMLGELSAIAMADDPKKAAEEQAKPVVDRAAEIATEYRAEISTEVAVGHPARQILNHAEGFETVAIGSHLGTLTDRLLVGNVAERVFRRSPTPVTIVR